MSGTNLVPAVYEGIIFPSLSCRPYSAFELRTYDPEGVLIFGDTEGGKDWFLLGLRDGRPEIQIHNQLAKVTINGGPRINDGAWHKVRKTRRFLTSSCVHRYTLYLIYIPFIYGRDL